MEMVRISRTSVIHTTGSWYHQSETGLTLTLNHSENPNSSVV